MSACENRISQTTPRSPTTLTSRLALVLEVLGEIDRSHTARTQLFLDSVAVCEGGFETVEKVRHYVLAPLATIIE